MVRISTSASRRMIDLKLSNVSHLLESVLISVNVPRYTDLEIIPFYC